jgi:hypothetical protein
MKDVIDWVEKAALENLRSHLLSTDAMTREANSTLTILLAALSGAFAYALKGDEHAGLAYVLTTYLSLLSLLLVWFCMRITRAPAPTNEPRNLMQEGYELEALRRAELKNIQERIDEAAQRNFVTARWLNRVRMAAVCAPLAAVLLTFAAS